MPFHIAIAPGTRVRVTRKHWLAGGRTGTVLAHRPVREDGRPALNQIRVQLDRPYVGTFDTLNFAEQDVTVLDE